MPRPAIRSPRYASSCRHLSLVGDEGLERIPLESLASLQKGKLDQKRRADDLAAQPLDEPESRRHRPARGEQIVHREHALAGPDGVLVNGEDVPPVLELVLLFDGPRGQLAALADRDETRAELMRQRA